MVRILKEVILTFQFYKKTIKREALSAKLDNGLDRSTYHQDINQHNEQIVDAVKTCLNEVCPSQETIAETELWEDEELQEKEKKGEK